VVENASLPTERRIVTTLARLGEAVEGVSGPALLIIGEAMALAIPLPEPLAPALAGEGGANPLPAGERSTRADLSARAGEGPPAAARGAPA
jgi:uroporphyrin-III C-methyltransferase